MKTLPFWLLFPSFLMAITSFSQPAPSTLVSANTKFGFKLYSELAKETPGQNIFISPASIAMCLTMAYNGARAETAAGMAKALELEGTRLQELNVAYANLQKSLAQPATGVQMEVANSIWARKGIPFHPVFLKTNGEYFQAKVSELNFDDPSAASTINSWVSQKTRNKIDRIVESISADSVLFLLNAIYFKGIWTHEFDPSRTKQERFTSGSGQSEIHPMMRQSGNFRYLETNDFQGISLPYGDGRISMYVLLPKTMSLQEFHQRLSAAEWEKWMARFANAEGEIVLPRFKLVYERTLNDSLKALGMERAFDPNGADFSGMVQTTKNAFISKVRHKAFAEVNEEGTEAAAATSTEISIVSMPVPSKRFQMIVNRPFFFAIRDNTTGTLLFLGSITDPE